MVKDTSLDMSGMILKDSDGQYVYYPFSAMANIATLQAFLQSIKIQNKATPLPIDKHFITIVNQQYRQELNVMFEIMKILSWSI